MKLPPVCLWAAPESPQEKNKCNGHNIFMMKLPSIFPWANICHFHFTNWKYNCSFSLTLLSTIGFSGWGADLPSIRDRVKICVEEHQLWNTKIGLTFLSLFTLLQILQLFDKLGLVFIACSSFNFSSFEFLEAISIKLRIFQNCRKIEKIC